MKAENFIRWNPTDAANAVRLRGAFHGCVAVVAFCDGEACYSTLATSDRTNAQDAADDLLARLSPDELLYAIIPSCDPDRIKDEVLSVWTDSASLARDGLRKMPNGRHFTDTLPDAMLDGVRQAALRLFAEQSKVSFVCRRGTATA